MPWQLRQLEVWQGAFIVAGAFAGLEEIIASRKGKHGIGFGALIGALWLASTGASRQRMRLRLPVLAMLGCAVIGVFALSTSFILSFTFSDLMI